MNNKRKAAALALSLLLLAGCGTAKSSSSELPVQTTEALDQQAEMEAWRPDGTMVPVDGKEMWSTQGDTAWFTGDASVDGGMIWNIIDLRTGEWHAFCAKEGCGHTDRSCGGWIELGNSVQLCPLLDGTVALLYGPTTSPENEIEPLTLELRDKSGEVLCSASVEAEPLDGVIYRDDAALYQIRREYPQPKNGSVTDVLVRISLESETFGQKQEITHWKNDSKTFWPGICTENGILAAATAFEKDSSGARLPMGGVLYELEWDGNRRTLAQAAERQAFWLPLSGQSSAFRYDYDTGALEQLDLETGAYSLFAQLQPGLSLTEGSVFTDGWLFCNVSDGTQDFTIAVQRGGQPQRSPLQAVHNGRQQSPVVRQALEGGRLLVEVGQTEVPVQYQDDDGALVNGVTSKKLWGIFTPEQYLNGDTSYVMVEPEWET